MSTLPNISEAEWKVMEVIWQNHPIGGSAVASHLEANANWHIKTVKTLLSRLVQKGAIDFQKVKNAHLYSPLIERDKYILKDSIGFVDRLFGGKATDALLFFMESTDLNDEDIGQLETMLKQKQHDKNG